MALQGDIFKAGPDGSLTTFEQAFPTIATVEVDIDETGEGNQGLGRRSLTRRSVREFINCSNPHCGGKGLDLGALLRQMVEERGTTLMVKRDCLSRDENGRACPNTFSVAVRVTYYGNDTTAGRP